MRGWLVVLAFFAAPVATLAALLTLTSDPHFEVLVAARRSIRARLLRRRGPDPRPAGRPIQQIARDARRLGRQLQHADDGRSQARITAIRRSYDDVLAEACRSLGVAELLGVLSDGPELDRERHRVEVALAGAGMVLEEAY